MGSICAQSKHKTMVANVKTPKDAGFSVQLDRVQFAANILGVFGMLLASLQPNASLNFDQFEVLDRSIEMGCHLFLSPKNVIRKTFFTAL